MAVYTMKVSPERLRIFPVYAVVLFSGNIRWAGERGLSADFVVLPRPRLIESERKDKSRRQIPRKN